MLNIIYRKIFLLRYFYFVVAVRYIVICFSDIGSNDIILALWEYDSLSKEIYNSEIYNQDEK